MALQNSQYDALMRYYQRLQFRNKHEQDARIAEAQARIPRLALIDQEIAAISVKKARILLGDKNATDFDLNEQIQALSRERTDLLKANGYPEDYLKMHYTCPLCQDTGYVDNRKCICFRRAISEHLYTQSNIRELLKTASFDAFSLDYYPEDMVNEATGQTARQSAATALQRSKDFVQNFDHSFENLFIYGDTGVGKTFLTYCIAKELLDSMHSVIYYSAFDLFDAFARNTFSNSDTTEGENDYILNCDLLIIDDLGTELTNSFVASQFFLCINERILRKKSTVISTNLTLGSFMDTYSERVFSRVSSNYTMIKLIGKDIRIQKKSIRRKLTMSHNKNHDSQQLPVGRLGIISPYSCAELGTKVDNYLVSWRKKRHNEGVLYEGYDRDTYLIGSDLPRFGSGEAKGILKESVRGDDIYILVDVCNYSLTYSLAGQTNHMSPDDHYQNLKRIIAAIAGKARRINVIMPFLYESRQHRRTGRESLDCALALQELIQMGVENIITFDAHDPRIQNAIPLYGFETVQSAYQFIKNLLKKEKDLKLDKEHLMVISPDEGGMSRAIYLANTKKYGKIGIRNEALKSGDDVTMEVMIRACVL